MKKNFVELERVAVANVLSEFTVSEIARNPDEVRMVLLRASELRLQSTRRPLKAAA